MHIPDSLRSLHIQLGRSVTKEFLDGWAKTVRWQGMDFVWLQTYVPWDDPKRIDWKTTAKKNELFVKQVEDEHRDVWFVQDTKGVKIKELIYAMGFAALKDGERIGEINGNKTISLARKRENLAAMLTWTKRKDHIFWFFSLLQYILFGGKKRVADMSISQKLSQMQAMHIKKSMIVVVTHEMEIDESLIQALGVHNKILWIHVFDAHELHGTHAAVVEYVWDVNRVVVHNTTQWQKTYTQMIADRLQLFKKIVTWAWWHHVVLDATGDIVKDLMKHIRK